MSWNLTLTTRMRTTRFVIAVTGCLSLGIAAQAGLWHTLSRTVAAPGAELVESMQVQLNGVSLSILGYLQSHRADYLNSVKTNGQASTALLKQFTLVSSEAFPTLTSRIETSHAAQREATLAILNAENEQLQARLTLEKNRTLLLHVLNDKLLVNTRSAVWRGSDRLRGLLTAIAEVKGLGNAAWTESVSTDEDVFQRSLSDYSRQTSGRQSAVIAEALRLWDACRAAAYQVQDQDHLKLKALATFTRARSDLDQALDDYRRVTKPAPESGAAHRPHISAWMWLALSLGIFGIGGVQALRMLRTQRHTDEALEELLTCIDASAVGDLTRVPGPFSDLMVHRLGEALARLNTVVTRSENLVYHLAALVEISGDAIVSQTLDGTILSWNKGAQRLYGYSVDDVRGHSIGILSPMDHGEELRMVLGQVKRGEKVTPFETLHQAKNGRLVRALVKAAAVHDSLHRVIGVSFCAQELPAPATSSTAIPLTDTLQKS
jgi:PAS domain S-box-containing protein